MTRANVDARVTKLVVVVQEVRVAALSLHTTCKHLQRSGIHVLQLLGWITVLHRCSLLLHDAVA